MLVTVPAADHLAVRAGLAALAALPLLKALAVEQFLAALSAGATSALLVVLAKDRLGGGQGFGVLVVAIGAGAALGPLLLLRGIRPSSFRRVGHRLGSGRLDRLTRIYDSHL